MDVKSADLAYSGVHVAKLVSCCALVKQVGLIGRTHLDYDIYCHHYLRPRLLFVSPTIFVGSLLLCLYKISPQNW